MRIENAQTIDTALSRYAVLLDRVAWLNPAWQEVQRDAWLSLIERFGADHMGLLTVTDFEHAINAELRAHTNPRDILPPGIIAVACAFAADRAERARQVINYSVEQTIGNERVRLSAALQRAKGPDEIADAVAVFRAETDMVIAVLVTSGYDHATIDPVIERIRQQTAFAIDHVAPFGQLG